MLIYLQLLLWRSIFTSKKAKTNINNQLDIPITIITTFVFKKAKIAKNVLNKKALTIGISSANIVVSALRFLLAKK